MRRKGEPSGRCTVCSHVEKTRIELLVIGGASQRAVARKYAISRFALNRHFASHVSPERRATLIMGPVQRMALAAQVAEESASILDHHKAVRAGLYRVFDSAITAGDMTGSAMLAGRLTELNNSISRLTGELANSPLVQHNTTNVFLTSGAALDFFNEMARQLADHPEALKKLIGWIESKKAVALPPIEHKAT